MKALENSAKIAEIQSRLNKYPYLSKTSLPGYADGRVFQLLQSIKRFPDRSINPHFYHWYILMKQFSPSTIAKWVADQLYFDPDEPLISEFVKAYNRKEQPESAEEARPRTENPNEFEYTVDIKIKNEIEGKVQTLEKILEEYRAEPIEIEKIEENDSKFIRVIYRIDAANNDKMVNKISTSIEYENIQIKKRPMKGSASIGLDKNTNDT